MTDETLWPWMLLGILLALPSLPGTIELLLLTLGGILPPRRRGGSMRLSHQQPTA